MPTSIVDMLKKRNALRKLENERYRIPKSLQEVIPVRAIYEDGVFLSPDGRYSKTYLLEDINFAVASEEEKKTIISAYSQILNSFDTAAEYKITVNVRRKDRKAFERDVLLDNKQDGMDGLREDVNAALIRQLSGAGGFVQEKYLTLSIPRKSIEEARLYFLRVEVDLQARYKRLGSGMTALSTTERLRIFHSFYRAGEETAYRFDLQETMRKGHSFKDYIGPDSFEFKADHFCMGGRYGRVFFLREYANFIEDKFLSEICSFSQSMLVSMDVFPVPMDKAVREANKRALGVEANIARWQQRQNRQSNYSAMIPYEMEQQRKESQEYLHDLNARDQRMFMGILTIVLTADTAEELEQTSEALLSIGAEKACQIAVLRFQQMDGLNTVLPFGVQRIEARRTLLTESVAVFVPFRAQEISDPKGIYYGINPISRNPILCSKANLLNPSAWRLGVPGSGKSMGMKDEIYRIALGTEDDILVCDPEGEYSPLIQALGGQVIQVAPGSGHHINAMDMTNGYAPEGEDPIIAKSQFVLSLFEQVTGGQEQINIIQKGIIDNCVRRVYTECEKGGEPPTLAALQKALYNHPDEEARPLAKMLELFVNGSLNLFAHPTNVNLSSRLVSYDILRLGTQMKALGLLVIMDALMNRVAKNWKEGRKTHIIMDEFHVIFEHQYSAQFALVAWRQFRKRNGYPTGLTQNVEYLMQSKESRMLLSNSEFVVMHSQSASDRQILAELFSLSPEQLRYVTDAEPGSGLVKVGHCVTPFINWVPPSEMYNLITTKPGEGHLKEA